MSNSAFQITLPKSWPTVVRSAMLHVVSLAKYAAVYTRSWAADSPNARVRLRADNDRLQQEVALLRGGVADQGRPYGQRPTAPTTVLCTD